MTPDGPLGARKKVLIPTFLLHPDADALLQKLGQPPETTEAAGLLLKLLLPGLWPTFVLDVMDKHFQASGYTSPPMVFSAFATLLNAIVCYALVYYTKLDFYGAGVASR